MGHKLTSKGQVTIPKAIRDPRRFRQAFPDLEIVAP